MTHNSLFKKFEVKLIYKNLSKFYNFSTKSSIKKKTYNSFYQKKFPKKLESRHKKQPNTLSRLKYKVIKVGSGSEKIDPDTKKSFRIHNTAYRTCMLQDKPSALKREHPALQKSN
jgi:hypothetical protein